MKQLWFRKFQKYWFITPIKFGISYKRCDYFALVMMHKAIDWLTHPYLTDSKIQMWRPVKKDMIAAPD